MNLERDGGGGGGWGGYFVYISSIICGLYPTINIVFISSYLTLIYCYLGNALSFRSSRMRSQWRINIVYIYIHYKANLRDLIAATGLVILLKLDSNRRFFSPCDLEIWWMTPKNNRAPLVCYFKLFASFRSHWWIQTGVTVWKQLIWVKIDDFFSRVTLKFDERPSKTIGHLFSATSSFVQHFVAIGEFKLELQIGNA